MARPRRRVLAAAATAAAIVAILVAPRAAAAQDAGTPGAGAVFPEVVQAGPPRQAMGLRAFASVDIQRMTAARTFESVLGSPQVMAFGGGGEVLRVWRNAFARVAISRSSSEGTRVVVFDNDASPIGVDTSIRMLPLELAGGWRFHGRGRLVPYGGGGVVRLSFEETTEFDEPTDDTSETFLGSLVFGGLDLHLGGAFGVGAEVQHRRLPDAIGSAGASAAFGEHDLGGLTFRVWIGIGR